MRPHPRWTAPGSGTTLCSGGREDSRCVRRVRLQSALEGIAPTSVRVADGVVYVLDRLAASVYAHRASDGAFIRAIGRKGEGPGEVEQPMGVALQPGVVILADGASETEVFDTAGTYLRSIRPNGIVFGVEPLGTDRLLLRLFQSEDSPRWTVLGPSGEPRPLDPPAWLAEAPEDVPECSSGATTGTTILHVDCALLRFQHITVDGAVLWEITVDRAPEYSTEAELDAHEKRIRGLLGRMGARADEVDRMVREQREERRLKRIFRGIRRDAETGRTWVWEQAPEDFGGGPATLHLFDEGGVYLARVPFERAWFSFDAADGRVYALERDPETDLARLVAYDVEVPAVGMAERD
ncbi:MAG TPA: 6-bladed beta-propeller [Longimicrobiales bacterium]